MRLHDDQLEIDADVVRGLVDAQFPQWADREVRAVRGPGTVNAIFRVGGDLTARFPLQDGDPDVVRRGLQAEQDAARELAEVSPVPSPVPVALGEPGPGYPLPWSVQTWVPGVTADERDPSGSDLFAEDLARFVLAVGALDTRGRTFSGDGRGGDLRDSDAWVAHCLDRSQRLVDVDAGRRAWARMRQLPRTDPDAMTHGDLTTGNVLVTDGLGLGGVLDPGSLSAADPALELVGGWHLLDDERRARFRSLVGSDDLAWARGRAWAFQQAMGLVWYYADSNPAMARMGRVTLDRVLASLG